MPWLRLLVVELSPRRLTFDPRPVHARRGGQGGTGTGLSASPSVHPCQYNSTNTPSSSSTRCSYQEDKDARPGNLPKKKNAVP